MANVREKKKGYTLANLVNISVRSAAYPLNELVLILWIPSAYVTGQRVRVQSHSKTRILAGLLANERN